MWTDGSNGRKGAQFRAMILIKLLIYSQKKLSHMNHGSATSTFSEFIIFFFIYHYDWEGMKINE